MSDIDHLITLCHCDCIIGIFINGNPFFSYMDYLSGIDEKEQFDKVLLRFCSLDSSSGISPT